jgi:SAM-dependent methyltransferase
MDARRLKELEQGRERNPVYHREVDGLFRFLVPAGSRVLELGCGTGRLLASLAPVTGLGIDVDERKIEAARDLHRGVAGLEFRSGDAGKVDWTGIQPFDYILLSDLLPLLPDVQATLSSLAPVCTPGTRLVLQYHSNLWRPVLDAATTLGWREHTPDYSWLSRTDVANLLALASYQVVTVGGRTLLPARVPGVEALVNGLLARLPLFQLLTLTQYTVARPLPAPLPVTGPEAPSVSVVVPARNEKGNIEAAFLRTPAMGRWTELLFIDGDSSDGTYEEIERCIKKHGRRFKRCVLERQTGKGKGQAVRQAFARAKGDVLMILDSDLTMPPEELPKYYGALVEGKGELINGCRLVYPMEGRAMRFLNMVANHGFGKVFTWLMGQPVKDTLCGTKVLWRRDYETLAANRSYFGEFDPFGDFDLLFGASRLNRKIVDMPIRYKDRTYGDTKISRFRHGLLLARMCVVAFRKLKLS